MSKIIHYAGLFHQASKLFLKEPFSTFVRSSTWPEKWMRVKYKSYPRMPKINLPETIRKDYLYDIIQNRQSKRDFSSCPITREEASILFRYTCGNVCSAERTTGDALSHRAQPSAGACFPVELYALVRYDTPDMPSGLYHYNVKLHAMELLWERKWTDGDLKQYFFEEWPKKAGIVFFMTAVFKRVQLKYRERGYRHILLEAGHIGQNLYLVAETLDLGCCAIGGTRDQEIEQLLDIDGITESVVYTIAVGH